MPTNNGLKINTFLYNRTRELLANRPVNLTFSKISEETNISRRWLEQISTDRCKKADAERVEALYVYLTKQPLTLV